MSNRLTETIHAATTLQPIYNGLGDRVGQTIDASTTDFALDVQGLPEVIYTSAGNAYLHLPGLIMADSPSEGQRYLLADGLGSIRHAADDAATVAVYQEFDPYGVPLMSEGGGDPYGYTGEWWADEVDLLHLRARWYAPYLNQFLSPDPIIPDYFNPQSLNQYAYVLNNPVNGTDPSGMCAQFGDDACWNVYERIIRLCPECATMTRSTFTGDRQLHQENILYLQAVLARVQAGWRSGPSDEYRRMQIMNYGKQMAALVKSGDITDLEALARITEFAAKLYDENSKTEIHAFVDDVGLVLVGHSGPLAPFKVEGPFKQPESQYTVREFGASGFHPLLRDSSNQLRHFWFAVEVEMCYPSELNKLQGILHETAFLSGTPGGRSAADTMLSFEGSDLGIELDNGTIKLTEIGDWVRKNLY